MNTTSTVTHYNFSAIQLDALREIGNVGAGNAATALGQLLDKVVMIDVPRVQLLSLDTLNTSDFLKEPKEISLAIYSKILGPLQGGLLVLFSKNDSLRMSDLLLKKTAGTTALLTLVDMSALSETAYILCCSYLNAVGQILNLQDLTPIIPQVAVDNIDNINKVLVKKFVGNEISHIMSTENYIIIEDIALTIFITMLLEQESVKKAFEILGM